VSGCLGRRWDCVCTVAAAHSGMQQEGPCRANHLLGAGRLGCKGADGGAKAQLGKGSLEP
jgi:hypothetical protein